MTTLIPAKTMQTIQNRARNLQDEGYRVESEIIEGVYQITDGDRRHVVDAEQTHCDCRSFAVRQVCAHTLGIALLVDVWREDTSTLARLKRAARNWDNCKARQVEALVGNGDVRAAANALQDAADWFSIVMKLYRTETGASWNQAMAEATR